MRVFQASIFALIRRAKGRSQATMPPKGCLALLRWPLVLVRVLLTGLLIEFPVSASQAEAPPQPLVFKIQFEWGATNPEGASYKGNAVAQFAPSSQWTGHFGANMKAISGKGFDETSPAALYQGLGNLAAMRPADLLQFYKASYSATVTTGNGCSFTDKQTDPPDTYTVSIKRTKEGAVLEFWTLEAADSEGRCDYDDAFISKDYAPGQDTVKKEFFTFHLTQDDLAHFKTIRKVNTCSLDAIDPTPAKIWAKATLTAE